MRRREYTELYVKGHNDLDNHNGHDGVVTPLKLNILECEGKWALGSITTNKARRGDRIPTELFPNLKCDAVQVLHSTCQQIWKTQPWPQDKVSFHSNPKEKQCQRMLKLPHNCTYLACQ